MAATARASGVPAAGLEAADEDARVAGATAAAAPSDGAAQALGLKVAARTASRTRFTASTIHSEPGDCLTTQPRGWCMATSFFSFSRATRDRKSTRLNSSHVKISYAVFCL